MALIACPECGKEISDKVQACPHCGYPLAQDVKSEVANAPVAVSRKSLVGKVIVVLVVVAGLVVASIYGVTAQKEKAYIEKLEQASSTMLLAASTSENVLDVVGQVWYNAIYEEYDATTNDFTRPDGYFVDDFNVALFNYYGSDSAMSAFSAIEANQREVQALMQELQEPPKKLQNSYETITELYLAYQSLTNFALRPQGSLSSFSDDKRGKIDRFTELYTKLETQLPE